MQPDSDGAATSQAFPIASIEAASKLKTAQKAFSSFNFAAFQARSNVQARAEAGSKGEATEHKQTFIIFRQCSHPKPHIAFSEPFCMACLQRPNCDKLPSTSCHRPAMTTTMLQIKRPSPKGALKKYKEPKTRHMIDHHRWQRRRGSAKIASKRLEDGAPWPLTHTDCLSSSTCMLVCETCAAHEITDTGTGRRDIPMEGFSSKMC